MGEGEPQPGRLGFSSTVQTGVQQFERRDLSHSSSHSLFARVSEIEKMKSKVVGGRKKNLEIFFFFFFLN